MALSGRATALAPYVQQLLYDEEAWDAARRAAVATRKVYGRARGKSAREAAKDKKLRRRLQEALAAACEVWRVIGQPASRPNPHWRRRLTVVIVGGAGVLLAVNTEARQCVLGLLGKNDPKATNQTQ
jgi:hypothetical protein